MRSTLIALLSVVAVALVAVALFVVNGTRNARYAAEFMAAADDPYLLDLDGKYVDLADWEKGRIVVTIFTRTDCPISNRFAPEVRRLYDEFHPQGVQFYLVYVDPREEPEEIRRHLADFEYPCPGLADPEHTFARRTGATVTPEAVVFDADHKITYRGRIDNSYDDLGSARSEATTRDLANAIDATLQGKPVAEPVTKAVGCYIADLK